MQLLEKDLLIENLRKEMKVMEDRILAMEMQKEPEKEMVAYSKNVQQFFENYKSIFGDTTLTDLSSKLDYMERTFIDKYAADGDKHLDCFQRRLKEGQQR